MVGSNTTASGINTVGLLPGQLFGANFAVVGDGSSFSGNNNSGVLNLVFLGANSIDSGDNNEGGINIAVELPGATDVGNCAAALCINLFGLNL